ncbi:hypothetical protein [Desulfosporosinus sp. Sb-LF]|nr:hypothetical protein [Desulfosporosinus sp. Sb-LF]
MKFKKVAVLGGAGTMGTDIPKQQQLFVNKLAKRASRLKKPLAFW